MVILTVMEKIIAQDLRKYGVTTKQYVLGRRDTSIDIGAMKIGRYLALDKSMGAEVYIDALRPHVVLICGKRGYGKSYTMGTFVEEIASLRDDIRKNIACLIIDTMGIFWSLKYPNAKEKNVLSAWGMSPIAFEADIFVPSGNIEHYKTMNIDVAPFSISASELSGYDWCSLFHIEPVSSLGIFLIKTIENLREKKDDFSLDIIIDEIRKNEGMEKMDAALNYFLMARTWGIFGEKPAGILELIRPGSTNILDISSLDDLSIRAIVVRIMAKKIYDERIKARRSYERIEMGDDSVEKGIPMVWMFIDEAHMFLPAEGETQATGVLVNEWLRQGRQPGLSVVLATQRPSSLHSDVMSQSDIIICHRLTAQDDITALEAIQPTYMREGIADSLKKMGTEKGVALIIDDTSEASHIVRMRPRKSWHGGDEPSALRG